MVKLELKLFVQANCPKCPTAKAVVQELLKKRDDIELRILDIGNQENYLSALMLQISSTPALAVEDNVLFVGNPPTLEKLSSRIDDLRRKTDS